MSSSIYDSELVAEWLDGRLPTAVHAWTGRTADEPLLPAAARWPVYRVDEDGDDANPRLPTALEALVESHLLAALPHRIQKLLRSGVPNVISITTPDVDWTEAVADAAIYIFRGAHLLTAKIAPSKGGNRWKSTSIDRPTIAISSDPTWLSTTIIAGADFSVEIRPDPRAVERAIEVVCGRGARVKAADIAGLDLASMAFAIRPGASPRSCVRTLRRLAAQVRRPAMAQFGDRTPTLDRLVGYGSAIAKVRAVAADIELVKAGELMASELPSLLLYGPPGTGKTLLARSLAKSTGLPMVEASISAWFQTGDGYLGGVNKNAKKFFDDALAAAPCIAFLDELDALPDRAALDARGRDWWNPLVTGILLLIDKTRAAGTGVVLVAATNYLPHIDAALKRPGPVRPPYRDPRATDPPSFQWTPMLAFRSWRGVSDECSTPGVSGIVQAGGG